MPEGTLTRCSRAGELGAGVSRTRGRSSSPGTEREGVSPQEGEAPGEETGEALRRGQFVPIAGRLSAYRRDPAAVRECCLCEGERSALWPARCTGGRSSAAGEGGAVSPVWKGTPRRSPRGLFPARGSHAADVKARCLPGRCSCPQRCLAGDFRRRAARPAERHAGRQEAPGEKPPPERRQ